MKKNFFYLCVLFIWSVVGACAAAASDAPLRLEKPGTTPCMQWLQELETKRSRLLQQVEDQKSLDVLAAYTKEISATIGGKYGISSTPATTQEREEIIRSIHRTHKINLFSSNFMGEYLGYDTINERLLSEDSLREIAERTETDLEVLQSHLAAIAVVDGASFSSEVGDHLDPANIRRNILFIHNDACKDNLNRLLGPIFEPAKKPLVDTLIHTLKAFEKTEDKPASIFLKSALVYHEYTRHQEYLTNQDFFKFCRSLTETSQSDLLPDKKNACRSLRV